MRPSDLRQILKDATTVIRIRSKYTIHIKYLDDTDDTIKFNGFDDTKFSIKTHERGVFTSINHTPELIAKPGHTVIACNVKSFEIIDKEINLIDLKNQ